MMLPPALASRLALIAIVAGGACALAGGPGAANADAARWVVRGAGSGHGVGMSQYGAYGYARKGFRYRRILARYYRRTEIGDRGSHTIRVLLAAGKPRVGFRRATRACGQELDSSRSYRATRRGSRVILRTRSGEKLASCGRRLRATGRRGITISGFGRHRGALEVRPTSFGGLNVINAVSLDHYVRGVVPNEVPASWPAEALKAQAVAARSYALATDVGGRGFDQYDDTRSQVYGGRNSEERSTNRAVRKTAGEVVTYRGKVATTFFFSTSGGQTENVEVAMRGAEPKAYLKSVEDPYDHYSPYHRWRESFSQAEMDSRLGVPGSLRRIEVTKRGNSPRIVRAKLIGSRGTVRVRGSTLRSQLGLRDTWAFFHKR